MRGMDSGCTPNFPCGVCADCKAKQDNGDSEFSGPSVRAKLDSLETKDMNGELDSETDKLKSCLARCSAQLYDCYDIWKFYVPRSQTEIDEYRALLVEADQLTGGM